MRLTKLGKKEKALSSLPSASSKIASIALYASL